MTGSMNLKRVGLGVAAVAVVIAVWGVVAVTQLGRLWPAPLVLPDTIAFDGGPYYKQAGCHMRAWYGEHRNLRGPRTARRVGTLPSALVLGEKPEYGPNLHTHNGYLLVPSGDCFVMYQSNAG